MTGNVLEDTQIFLATGAGVGDSNEPALENDVRISNSSTNRNEYQHEDWTGGMPGACPRLESGHRHKNLKLDAPLEDDRCIAYFLKILPVVCIKGVIVPETNKHLHWPQKH